MVLSSSHKQQGATRLVHECCLLTLHTYADFDLDKLLSLLLRPVFLVSPLLLPPFVSHM